MAGQPDTVWEEDGGSAEGTDAQDQAPVESDGRRDSEVPAAPHDGAEDNSTKISWLKRDGEAHLLHCPALSRTNTQVAKVSGTAILYAISTAAPDVHGAVRINSLVGVDLRPSSRW
jgi:hypothetical protein